MLEDKVFPILRGELCTYLKKVVELEQECSAWVDDPKRIDRPLPDRDSLALLFRRERIVRMCDLNEIADQLKIRKYYLQAIEDGAYEDLPNGTYAVGFVRAYAEFLGLDSAAIVERFKSEVEQTEDPLIPPQLLLTKKRETRTPSGATILISLLLIACTYANWFYRSGNDQAILVQQTPFELVDRE